MVTYDWILWTVIDPLYWKSIFRFFLDANLSITLALKSIMLWTRSFSIDSIAKAVSRLSSMVLLRKLILFKHEKLLSASLEVFGMVMIIFNHFISLEKHSSKLFSSANPNKSVVFFTFLKSFLPYKINNSVFNLDFSRNGNRAQTLSSSVCGKFSLEHRKGIKIK